MSIQYHLMANYVLYRKLLMKRLAGTGLTAGQPKILDYLKDHDGAGQSEIAAACYLESATLTGILNGMEEKGLVERRRGGGDRRSCHVFMTEKGKEMCARVSDAFARLEKQAFGSLSAGQRQELEQLLEGIHKVLDAVPGDE